MQDYVSIVRTDNRLRRAAYRLKNLRREVKEFYWGHTVTPDILELRNLVATASIIIDSAQLRKESRGSHYRTDFPTRNDGDFLRTTVARYDPASEQPELSYESVETGLVVPRERNYTTTHAPAKDKKTPAAAGA